MENGFIYPIFSYIVEKLRFINLVEGFKWLFYQANKSLIPNVSKTASHRIATDFFILIKWCFLLSVFFCSSSSVFLEIIVWYLLATNIYTYFFYHVWNILKIDESDEHRFKRRFQNLGLAFFFSVISFASIYKNFYSNEFIWKDKNISFLNSYLFSLSNSFTLSYEFVKPNSEVAFSLTILQTTITFIFVSIILTNSIPKPKS